MVKSTRGPLWIRGVGSRLRLGLELKCGRSAKPRATGRRWDSDGHEWADKPAELVTIRSLLEPTEFSPPSQPFNSLITLSSLWKMLDPCEAVLQ